MEAGGTCCLSSATRRESTSTPADAVRTRVTNRRRIAVLFFALFAPSVMVVNALQLTSVADSSITPPAGGGGDSVTPVLSPDGRFVLFTSTANNLSVTSSNTAYRGAAAPRLNVFLRDRTNGTTTLVSINLAATGGGNGDSIASDVSTNGRYVLFESCGSDLVTDDTNGLNDVFVRDLLTGATRLVSVATDTGAANNESRDSVMTPDGRYVAFVSLANNLVADDTNGIADVFVRDLQLNTTTLASVGAMSNSASSSSEMPDITPDGHYVAFFSTATNLVTGVTNSGDIYVRDLVGGTTYWASTNALALLQSALGATSVLSASHAISDDGKYVAFKSCKPGGTTPYVALVLRHNLETAVTDVVHTNATIFGSTAFEETRSLDMTPDGRFVSFVANTNGTAGAINCVRVWDAQSGTSVLASGDMGGGIPADSLCAWPTLDPTGRWVAFLSAGTDNMVTNALIGPYHAFVRDLQTANTRLANTDSNGIGYGVSFTALSRLSTNGQCIAFSAPDGNLVPNDSNHSEDVFFRDMSVGSVELVSVRQPALPSATPNASSGGSALSVSSDGRFVAFASLADNVAPNDTNLCTDIFVRDVVAGVNYMVSVSTNGWSPTNANSTEASVSADGRYVVFSSSANSLVANDTNNLRDVFVRDLLNGTTTLISAKTNSSFSGNGESYAPMISADGQKVLFQSAANNITTGLVGFTNNLFYRDFQSGITRALTTTPSSPGSAGVYSYSMTLDGRWVAFIGALGGTTRYLYVWDAQITNRVYTNTTAGLLTVSISPDGSRLAYITNSTFGSTPQLFVADWKAKTNWPVAVITPLSSLRSGMRFSADGRYLTYASTTALVSPDTNATYDVYFYDLQTRTNILVSHRFDAAGAADGASDSSDISPDGRFFTYRSVATNLVPGDVNAAADVFLYDRLTDKTTLLSFNRFGDSPANGWSLPPQFTRDGRRVIFQSWASDLAAYDFNSSGDLFAYAMFYAGIARGGLPTSGPSLSWPVVAGKTYHVEFLDNLNNTNWQNGGGSVIISGEWAYFTDPDPTVAQRYYRIVAE